MSLMVWCDMITCGFKKAVFELYAMSGGQQAGLTHWVDTWWANGDVSPSQMAVVDRFDLKISDYIQSKAI